MPMVRDIMSSGIVTVDPESTVAQAATVMAEKRIGSVLVMEGEALAGIFTERDIVRALSQDFDAPGHPISHWMTRNPATITPEDTAEDALKRMLEGGFRHLPVKDGDQVVGVISIRDLAGVEAEAGADSS
jgi:CBS domain-containing protein